MIDNEEEDFDYDNDESWYENAMNALEGPANNHGTIYTEEEIADLSDEDKNIIRSRNILLNNGFEYVELQNGDYINDIITRSGVIHYPACSFVLAYQKDRSFMILFQIAGEDENIVNPVQMATMIFTNKYLGCYQFLEFFHTEEEITEDQKLFQTININRELKYKEKPSLEFYRSDDLDTNQKFLEKIGTYDPLLFEFLNEYIIVELPATSTIDQYKDLIKELEY
jgi:hypothetical protein